MFFKKDFYGKKLLEQNLGADDFLEVLETKIHAKIDRYTMKKLTVEETTVSEVLFCDGIVSNSGFVGYLTNMDASENNRTGIDFVISGFRLIKAPERAGLLEKALAEYLRLLPGLKDDNYQRYFREASDLFAKTDDAYYRLEPQGRWKNLGETLKVYVAENQDKFFV
jgi:hypothetical protein